MDNIETAQEQEPAHGLIISEEIRSYLYDLAKWANFLAIVGFAITGLMVISAFTVGAAMTTSKELQAMSMQMGGLGGLGFTIFFLIYAFLIFYPSLLMFKYATKAKIGILYGEQENLNEAISKLKSLFKYWGILAIIVICLYGMLIISAVLGGIAGA
ncbi:DUF5362 family protein [Pedobacter namyangjuensis]|uniref:DUF5362 family protein n=1 Tax=Pedobacter namyangjuensis TaxID=600626 RepID=UPI000DE1DE41|nr:DUF5362 family protein [Pedobacter namyangjuensis]